MTVAELIDHPPAVCRGCGLVLRGKAYYLGGKAFHPATNKQSKVNHFGGFVCSERCDYSAALELEKSMPGHQGQTRLSSELARDIARKWNDD